MNGCWLPDAWRSLSILKLMSSTCFMLWFSFRLPQTLERLAAQLELAYNASGGKKITIISHSMGGLLVKCFMCLHSDVRINIFLFLDLFLFLFSFSISYLPFHGFLVISFLASASVLLLAKSYNFMHVLQIFEKYVKNWIAIAAPFQGKWSYVNWTQQTIIIAALLDTKCRNEEPSFIEFNKIHNFASCNIFFFF